ncbi:MAG: AAA family ATPase, partial [Myxococcota bacterium]
MKIPYGQCDFESIREEGMFYSDKTIFLPMMENRDLFGSFQVFLRPRRFGKSTLIHMLRHYYDLNLKDRFERLFKGLYVYDHPTPEQGKYMVLYFDFSPVATDGDKDKMEKSFDALVSDECLGFIREYSYLLPGLESLLPSFERCPPAATQLSSLLSMVKGSGYKVFLLIDEYDNFAHSLLTKEAAQLKQQLQQEYEQEHRRSGTLYSSAFLGTGFVKAFYKAM